MAGRGPGDDAIAGLGGSLVSALCSVACVARCGLRASSCMRAQPVASRLGVGPRRLALRGLFHAEASHRQVHVQSRADHVTITYTRTHADLLQRCMSVRCSSLAAQHPPKHHLLFLSLNSHLSIITLSVCLSLSLLLSRHLRLCTNSELSSAELSNLSLNVIIAL